MPEVPWYEEFFAEAYPETNRRKVGRPAGEREVEFLIRELRLTPGMRVLDVGCGAGYHAVPLARRGFKVVGLDLSERMLADARAAAREADVAVEWMQSDMRGLAWQGAFDAVINMFTSFGYFPDDRDNFRVLDGMARALAPGGRLCLHVASYPFLLRHWQTRSWSRSDSGWYQLESSDLDLLRGVMNVRCVIVRPNGSQSETVNRLRLFAPHELVEWMTRAGLHHVASFGDFSSSAFTLESAGLVMIGERQPAPQTPSV